jgi:hypothetical protein
VNRQTWRGFRSAIVLPNSNRYSTAKFGRFGGFVQNEHSIPGDTFQRIVGLRNWLNGSGSRVVQCSLRKRQPNFEDNPAGVYQRRSMSEGVRHEISILRIFLDAASPFSGNFQA